MVQKISKDQLDRIFEALCKEYPKLLKRIYFQEGNAEQICGSISGVINKFLRRKLGVDSRAYSGMYKGRGTEFSGGKSGTGHCWVEFKFQPTDPYLFQKPRKRERTVIIDGAFAQFFPTATPIVFRNRIRLMIFLDDPIARKWYEGRQDTSFEDIKLRKELLK